VRVAIVANFSDRWAAFSALITKHNNTKFMNNADHTNITAKSHLLLPTVTKKPNKQTNKNENKTR
jgi:hypothetical protein